MSNVGTYKENLRVLSEIISNSSFKRIIREEDYDFYTSSILKFSNKYKDEISFDDKASNRELIKKIYKLLLSDYRKEYIYKNHIINDILLKEFSLSSTIVLSEFKANKSVADLVLINGKARVFEIKTELDTLDRLNTQLADYLKLFTDVNVVSHVSQEHRLFKFIQHTCYGLIILDDEFNLRVVKKAESNYGLLEHRPLLNCLRKSEVVNFFKEELDVILDVPNTKFYKEALKIIQDLDIRVFQKAVLKQLKGRNILEKGFINDKKVPTELKHICYSLDFDKQEYEKLFKFLRSPFNKYLHHVHALSPRQTV